MPLLYAITLALGTVSVYHMAAAMAAIPLLAAPGQLHQANAKFTGVLTTAISADAALGTLLVAAVGAARAVAADTASYLLSAWCATRIRTLPSPTPAPARRARQSAVRDIREGLAYCVGDPVLRPLLLALSITGMGTGLTATLMPYHLLTNLKVGTTGLGVIMGAISLGGLTGALAAPRLARRCETGPLLLHAWIVHGLMHLAPLLAGPGPAWLTVLALSAYVQGAAAACVGTTQQSVQQWTSPERFRSRVQQTSLWLTTGTPPLIALAAGALTTLVSVRTVMAVGVLVLLLPAAVLWRSPVHHLTADSREALDGAV